MKRSLVKQFEEQFGKEWVCTCKTPFEPKALEIISENRNSLIAHYVCPSCQREQMLAAAIRHNSKEETIKTPKIRLPQTAITADDVLDIREELAKIQTVGIKALDRRRAVSKRLSIEADNIIFPSENSGN